MRKESKPMKKKTYRILAMLLAGIMLLSSCKGDVDSSSAAGDEGTDLTTDEYYAQFNNLVVGEENVDVHPVLVGSGGYITDLVIHPKNSDVMYIRTDVGGAYRWEEETKEWTQLCWSFTIEGQYCVDGIALDPNDENVVYLFVGNNNIYVSTVYKSTDKGATWKDIGPDEIKADGNGKNRELGECIAVDPNNSNVIALGTRGTGFFVSENAGETWMKINVAGGNEEIRSIIADPTSGTINGRTKVWYLLVLGKGLYKSVDGAATWSQVSGLQEGVTYNGLASDRYGRVYVSYGGQREGNSDGKKEVVRGVVRLNKDGSWTNIGANLPADDGHTTYVALEVDYNNPNRIAVGVGTGVVEGSGANAWKPPIYYTTDGGATWTNITPIKTEKQAWEWKGKTHSVGAVASLTFGDGDELWMTDWTEVYYTANVSAATDEGRKWRTYIKNIEELVTFSGISVPNGLHDIVFCSADSSAFAIDDETVGQYPSQPGSRDNGRWQQADYCVAEPNFIVGAHTEQSSDNWSGTKGGVYYSYDGGYTWVGTNAIETGIHPGDIAVSADTTSILVMATCDGTVLYSFNRGRSWTFAEGAPSMFLPKHVWHGSSPLESDRNKGNVFYLMSPNGFYRSDDWGQNWTLTSETPEMDIYETRIVVQSIEGCPGEVWVHSQKGVWYSTDYGETFTKIEGLRGGKTDAVKMDLAIGAGKTKGTYTLYFMGYIGTNEYAVYYSEDKGKTWIKTTNYEDYTLAKLGIGMASWNQYGRVYFGSSGMGWNYIDTAEGVRYNAELKAAEEAANATSSETTN
jgi:hypothetical protein